MRLSIIIPSYWTGKIKEREEPFPDVVPFWTDEQVHENNKEPVESRAVYDHSASLSTDGTLGRLLGSIEKLTIPKRTKLQFIVIPSATSSLLQESAEEKVKEIVSFYSMENHDIKLSVFTHKQLMNLKQALVSENSLSLSYLLDLLPAFHSS